MQAIDVRIDLSPGAVLVEDMALQCLGRLIVEVGKTDRGDGASVSKISAAGSTFIVQMMRTGNVVEATVMLESEVDTLLSPVEQEQLAADMAGVPDLCGTDDIEVV